MMRYAAASTSLFLACIAATCILALTACGA